MTGCFRPFEVDRKGVVAVEMAFVLPVFLMVLWAILEFGRAMMVGQLVTNAARYGSRMAILDGSTNAEVTEDVKSYLVGCVGGISGDDVTVTIEIAPAPGNPDPGGQLSASRSRDVCSVTVSVPFERVGYVSGKYLASAQLTGHCAMRRE